MSAEILRSIPWRALQEIKKAFGLRYIGQNKEWTEVHWSKQRGRKNMVEKRHRGICVQSVLAKWYCGCLTILLQIEMRSVEGRDKSPYVWF